MHAAKAFSCGSRIAMFYFSQESSRWLLATLLKIDHWTLVCYNWGEDYNPFGILHLIFLFANFVLALLQLAHCLDIWEQRIPDQSLKFKLIPLVSWETSSFDKSLT